MRNRKNITFISILILITILINLFNLSHDDINLSSPLYYESTDSITTESIATESIATESIATEENISEESSLDKNLSDKNSSEEIFSKVSFLEDISSEISLSDENVSEESNGEQDTYDADISSLLLLDNSNTINEENIVIEETIDSNNQLMTGYTNTYVIQFINISLLNNDKILIYKNEHTTYTRPALITIKHYDENSNVTMNRACICLDLGSSLSSGQKMMKDYSFLSEAVSEDTLKKVTNVLLTSKAALLSSNYDNFNNVTDKEWIDYFSAQLVVWYTLGQMSYETLVLNCTQGYGDLSTCNTLITDARYRLSVPSFATTSNERPAYKMEYNYSTNMYELTLSDDNYYKDVYGNNIAPIISYWDMPTHYENGLTIQRTGNKIKLTSPDPIGTKSNPFKINMSKIYSTYNIFIYGYDNVQTVCNFDKTILDIEAGFDIYNDDIHTGSISIQKKDGYDTPKGAATLEGAIYGLYSEIEQTVLTDITKKSTYKSNQLVATFPQTDIYGNTSLNGIGVGKYYIQEISPALRVDADNYESYKTYAYYIDKETYKVEISNDMFNNTETVNVHKEVKEQPILQPLKIYKYYNKEENTCEALSDVGFSLYNYYDVISKYPQIYNSTTSTYDFSTISEEDWDTLESSKITLTSDGKTEVFTDKYGIAKTINLYTGKYIIRETTYPNAVIPMQPDVIDIADYDINGKIKEYYSYYSFNYLYKAQLKLNKLDGDTKEYIIDSCASFKLFDLNENKYLSYELIENDEISVIDEFETNSEGNIIMPFKLKVGIYRLEEIKAPACYHKGENIILNVQKAGITYMFESDYNKTVEDDTNSTSNWNKATVSTNKLGEIIHEIDVFNYKVYGTICINKLGESISTFGYKTISKYDIADLNFGYIPLQGVEFNVYDDQGNLLETITTNKEGKAYTKNLLSDNMYYFVEINADSQYHIDPDKKYSLYISSADYKEDETLEYNLDIYNELTTCQISIKKIGVDLSDEERPLKDVTFGLYNYGDITCNSITIPKDTLLSISTTDSNGLCDFCIKIPEGEYYIKELSCPDAYRLSDQVYDITIKYDNKETHIFDYYFNNPIKNYMIPEPKVLSESITLGRLDNYNIFMLTGGAIMLFIVLFSTVIFLKRRLLHSKKGIN